MATEITVRGAFEESQPPERGTVHASISYSGPSMEPVYTRVAGDLDVVQVSVAELKEGDDAAVTWWSAERLRTWSTRPWNQDGEQLPLVHHASVNIQVRFRDFDALSSWVGEHVTNTEGFRVTNIAWGLTRARRDELVRQVRERAVHDAVDRARLYADALGLGAISPVAIADPGMLSGDPHSGGGGGQPHAVMAAAPRQAAHGPDVELVPADIKVTASVDARFLVEGSGSSTTNSSAQALLEERIESEEDGNADPDVFEFRDDDAGYLAWLAAHPDGYVINILRSYSANQARLHRADCRTINGEHSKGAVLTGIYVKVCAEQRAELDRWATIQAGAPIVRCGICHPGSAAAQASSPRPSALAAAASAEIRHSIQGPSECSAAVEVWADKYIPFDSLAVWQRRLRDEVRSRCRQLEPSPEQVLHATFFGAKPPKADIENLLLYNIDSFKIAGRNGIRFEHGSGVLPHIDDAEYRFGYRYALAPQSDTFRHWRRERTLAEFAWTDLAATSDGTQLAKVWLALKRREPKVFIPAAPDTPFGVRVEVRPPHGRSPVWGGLMKGIIDGVVCAVQAHTDTTVLPDVTARLATVLPADSIEIEYHLLDQRRAVLGVVHRLVSPYRDGVKWDPCDHLCVAGELLAAEPSPPGVGSNWAIRGEIFEVSRLHS
ncbi:SIMPL domain-containing protein [Mycolicibacterium sp. XJ662]